MTRLRPLAVIVLVILAPGHKVSAAGEDDRPPDCGLNALYLILQITGHEADLTEIKRTLPARDDLGYSMAELVDAAHVFGLELRGVHFGKQDAPLGRSAIAYMEGLGEGHFVVLQPIGRTGSMVQVLDPPDAPQVLDYDQLLDSPSWTGRLLVPRTIAEWLASYCWIGIIVIALLFVLGPNRRWITTRAKFFSPSDPRRREPAAVLCNKK